MSKELQALKNIGLWGYQDSEGDLILCRMNNKEDFAIIENVLKEKEKQDKILRIIKTIPFELEYDEDTDDWHLYIIITTQDGKYMEPVAFGEGKNKYDLLKDMLIL